MNLDIPFDSEENVFAPQRLADLIEAARARNGIWRTEELDSVWNHQLDAPLEYELGGLRADFNDLNAFGTFRSLLHAPQPPLDLLGLIKLYAKAHKQDKESPLPEEVSNALYYTTIAAGIACHERILGPLSPQAVENGLKWCLDQPWIDPVSKTLIEKTIRRLADPL